MQRRHFLAAGGLTAAAPLFAESVATGAPAASAKGLFTQVNFTSDGLALSPAEYVVQLQEMVGHEDMHADNYSLGGAVTDLEQTFARLLGKPAAMFVPTGTLANHLAIRQLAGADRRVLVQAESHLYNDSGDCAQTLSGLNLIPLGEGQDGFGLAEVQRMVERAAAGRVVTRIGAISIENPVRRRDHAMLDFAQLQRICAYAREQGIRLHLDGARLFNLPLHSGRSLRHYSSMFDTVYVSLWKHFNGASGAILAGEASFIDGLFHQRRMFGGSLPQAWPQIAMVTQHAERYEAEYAQAWQVMNVLIERLQAAARFRFRKIESGTSRLFMTVDGVAGETFVQRAAQGGVIVARPHHESGEVPLQVNPSLLRRSADEVAQVLMAAGSE